VAKKQQREDSIYQRLIRAAQAHAKAFDRREPSSAEKARNPALTEVAAVRSELELAAAALKESLVELAAEVAAAGTKVRDDLMTRLVTLERERGDVERRRREFADSVANWDWKAEYRERLDYVGPFTLEHAPGESKLKLGACKLLVLPCPSGAELFGAIQTERARLEQAASSAWVKLKSVVLAGQGENGIPWPKLTEALDSKEMPFKKQEPAVLFALALAREGRIEPGWILQTRPPALSQQRSTVSLPRISQPGNAERLYALRIEQVQREVSQP
jgi:hypothetical protein